MEKIILEYLESNRLIKRNKKVLVATSGGPDSIALLHFLWRHKQLFEIEIMAITIDHCLRGAESENDAAFVEMCCQDWGIQCITRKVDVNSYKEANKVGTQVAARNLRYQLFEAILLEENIDYLAFGHHGDDQIETMIMALAKTTHANNLIGIPVKRNFAGKEIIRPFLCIGKNDIDQYLKMHQITPRIDQSNFTRDYMRNRVRLDVVPLLMKENLNLRKTTQQLAETIQEDESLLNSMAEKTFHEVVNIDKASNQIMINIKLLKPHPLSLQRRVFRLTLNHLYEYLPNQLTYRHENMLMKILSQSKNKIVHFPLELIVEKSYQSIYFYFAYNRIGEYTYRINDFGDTICLPDGSTISCIGSDSIEDSLVGDPFVYIMPTEQSIFPLYIRTRRAGDRMTYDGLIGTKKIKDIFIDAKVPRHQRNSWPILTSSGGEILWLVGLKRNTMTESTSNGYVTFRWS